MVKHTKMTDEQIKQAAKWLRKEFEGMYGPGSNLNSKDIAYLIERTYIDGAQSRQPEIDKLKTQNKELRQIFDEILEEALAAKAWEGQLAKALWVLMTDLERLFPLTIIEGGELEKQYNKANELLKKYEQ